MHVRCSPRLGAELLCSSKQLRHYHSPDDLSWDAWRLSDSEVERIDLENAASPEEADELEEMTAHEIAVDGYYVVAGIARHKYKQGWKFLTLWDVSQVSPSLVSHRLFVFQPIPNRALDVLRKGCFEEPSRSSSMKKLVGGETRRRAPLRVHGQHCPGH